MDETRNLFSVIKKNLQFAERSIFYHRVIYFGEHRFKFNDHPDSKLTLEYFMKQNVLAINRSYCDEKLSGLLLCYANQFIHVIEGSEETLMRHLQNLIVSIENGESRFGVLKVLACVHHVKRRLFPEWSTRCGVPPVLIHDFESNMDNDMVGVFIRSCVWKLYGLAEYLSSHKQAGTPANQDLYELTTFLPEDTLLAYFLSSEIDALRGLKEFTAKYGSVPEDSHYQELIWPAMCDFVPYNPYDDDDEQEPSKKQ